MILKKWGIKPVPAPLRPAQNSQRLIRAWPPPTYKRRCRLTARVMARLKKLNIRTFRNLVVLHREHAECLLQTLHLSRPTKLKTEDRVILRTNIIGVFRPVRNTSSKGAYQLRYVCEPVRPLGKNRLPLDGLLSNFILGTFKICRPK